MKVYALFHNWVDIYAYSLSHTNPFHQDLLGIYDTKEKAEQEAKNRGMILDQANTFLSNQTENMASIKEYEVE